MHTLANSEDLDEMLQYHQDLLCEEKMIIQLYLEIIMCKPLICTTNYPQTKLKNPLMHKGLTSISAPTAK